MAVVVRKRISPQETYGIVGIFDALGAKNFTDAQVATYIRAQEDILAAVHHKAADQASSRNLSTPKLFTFNDTIVIALEADPDDEYNAIKGFSTIVRRFISYSLTKGLFFRGAFSIGAYFVSDKHNMILGSAVSDAASWYEQTELIGAVATPKASMIVRKHELSDLKPPKHLLFEADVPCKRGTTHLYAVNWPKAFYVKGLRPTTCKAGEELSCLLSLLSANEVPIGTEDKYKHTISFFESAPTS